jgi:hypothetical protein
MDVVASTIGSEAVRGPVALAASTEVLGAAQNAADLPSTDLVSLVRAGLELHPRFRGRVSMLVIELVDQTIVVSGRLPSYYLKQLLQEAIRGVPGVVRIDNHVLVMRPEC